MKKALVLFLAVIIFTSCDDDPFEPVITAPDVIGYIHTNHAGSVIDTIGILSENPGDLDSGIYIHRISPNPVESEFNLSISLGTISEVTIWLTPSKYIANKGVFLVNNDFITPKSTGNSIILFEKDTLFRGQTTLMLSLYNENYNLPAGYYRVYVEVDSTLYWRDLYHIKYGED